MSDPQERLKSFAPAHEFFIGVDSDGCAFDTMELKHKECFTPTTIRCWDLQPVSKYARMASEFVNLYSKWRGLNRFPALLKVFDLLADWDEVARRSVTLPDVDALRAWERGEPAPGNPSLEAAVKRTGDPVLARALEWSTSVNAAIAQMVRGVPPFPGVRQGLQSAARVADIIVVSATPGEALEREWHEHGIDSFARVIAGQEMGKKAEHLALATTGRYAKDHVLMVGDALGDLKAAREAGALFYPIVPDDEEASWRRFHEEALGRLTRGEYAGAYEAQLIDAFARRLPETPPWKR